MQRVREIALRKLRVAQFVARDREILGQRQYFRGRFERRDALRSAAIEPETPAFVQQRLAAQRAVGVSGEKPIELRQRPLQVISAGRRQSGRRGGDVRPVRAGDGRRQVQAQGQFPRGEQGHLRGCVVRSRRQKILQQPRGLLEFILGQLDFDDLQLRHPPSLRRHALGEIVGIGAQSRFREVEFLQQISLQFGGLGQQPALRGGGGEAQEIGGRTQRLDGPAIRVDETAQQILPLPAQVRRQRGVRDVQQSLFGVTELSYLVQSLRQHEAALDRPRIRRSRP